MTQCFSALPGRAVVCIVREGSTEFVDAELGGLKSPQEAVYAARHLNNLIEVREEDEARIAQTFLQSQA